jgi:Proteasome subunit
VQSSRLNLLLASGTSDAASASTDGQTDERRASNIICQIKTSDITTLYYSDILLTNSSVVSPASAHFVHDVQLPIHSTTTAANVFLREVLLGITGKDFTLVAASKAAMRGATILKASDDKTRALNKHTLMAFSGEAGDTVQFAEYIQANVALYSMRNDSDLSPAAVSSFVRGELAKALRSKKPYNVNLLLGGWSELDKKPSLYWIDYLASAAKLPYAAHGYAQ